MNIDLTKDPKAKQLVSEMSFMRSKAKSTNSNKVASHSTSPLEMTREQFKARLYKLKPKNNRSVH